MDVGHEEPKVAEGGGGGFVDGFGLTGGNLKASEAGVGAGVCGELGGVKIKGLHTHADGAEVERGGWGLGFKLTGGGGDVI